MKNNLHHINLFDLFQIQLITQKMSILLTFYEIVDIYFAKVKTIIEEIDKGNPVFDLPSPISLNQLNEGDGPKNWYHGHEKLKTLLYKLQLYAHHNKHPTKIQKTLKTYLVIFGQRITFNIFENRVGSDYRIGKTIFRGKQILLSVDDNGNHSMPQYEEIMPILEMYSSKKLGKAMLNTLNSSNVDQTSQGLPPRIIRAASIFILLTHVCESAIPFLETIEEFERAILYNSDSDKPEKKILTIKKKTGRIPMADKITRSKLRDVAEGKITFKNAFSVDNYCIRGKYGTSNGRTWVLRDEAGALTGELSDFSDDGN